MGSTECDGSEQGSAATGADNVVIGEVDWTLGEECSDEDVRVKILG